MHRVVAPEDATHLRRRQRGHHRHVPSASQPRPLGDTAIGRLDQQASPASLQPFPRGVEATHRLPSAPRHAEEVTDAPPEAIRNLSMKVGGQLHRAARSLREGPTGHGTF